MTERSPNWSQTLAIEPAPGRHQCIVGKCFEPRASWARCRHFWVLVTCLLLAGIGPGFLHAKPKTDKFHGTVVAAGPKAITVKSRDNIYKVRTFSYSAQLEQKMQISKPQAGKNVTVRYVRGTDLATKVD